MLLLLLKMICNFGGHIIHCWQVNFEPHVEGSNSTQGMVSNSQSINLCLDLKTKIYTAVTSISSIGAMTSPSSLRLNPRGEFVSCQHERSHRTEGELTLNDAQ